MTYFRQQQEQQQQAQAPAAPQAPQRTFDVGSGVGGGGPGGIALATDRAPTSLEEGSPIGNVADFQGSNLPGHGSVSANSSSTGGGFGYSFADPAAAAKIGAGLSNLVYSVPLGGYITRAEADNPNSAYVKDWYGKPMTGGDPGANLKAKQIYGALGDLPRVENVSSALAQLNAASGTSPSAGPTMNETLRTSGINSPWGGPWEFPGWHLGP